MKSSSLALLVAATGLSAFMSPAATAAPLYTVRAEANGAVQQFESTDAVSATEGDLFLYSGGQRTSDASAAAQAGSLRASADATVNVPSSSLGGTASYASGRSRMILSDVVIIPLPGTTPSAAVPISLYLTLSGSLDTSAAIGSPHLGSAGGTASISVSGALAGVLFSGDRTKSTSASASDGTVTDSPISGTGILADSSSVLLTPDAMVAIDSPFTLDLTLIAGASAGYSYGGTTTASTAALATAHSLFNNTLTLGSNGQVFNLPAGYTANSIDGMIVNNQLVPEPSTLALAAFAFISVVAWGWRRIRS